MTPQQIKEREPFIRYMVNKNMAKGFSKVESFNLVIDILAQPGVLDAVNNAIVKGGKE